MTAKTKTVKAETENAPMILCADGEIRPVSEYAEWEAQYEAPAEDS